MNKQITDEFTRLIAYTNDEYETAISEKDKKKTNILLFKIKQLKRALSILKNHDKKITRDNFLDLNDIQGIGKGTLNRIEEILTVDRLSELGNFKDNNDDKKKIIAELESVINIGKSKAIEYYENGITSVKDLKNKHKNGEIDLNNKILLGLKYYGKVKGDIPRDEINKINILLNNVIKQFNKQEKTTKENQFQFQIAGSYRREKRTSGDIDILITKLDTKDKLKSKDEHLEKIVKLLKTKLKDNNNKSFLIDDMTDKNVKTKYMGFAKYLDNPIRRVDIRFVTFESYHSALLYFTGSADLNKQMRQIAKDKGYKLSEYGLFDKDGNKIKSKSEEDIFNKLDMKFVEPKFR
jgi:DNA polymerase/3'-5' exonuclease PolX